MPASITSRKTKGRVRGRRATQQQPASPAPAVPATLSECLQPLITAALATTVHAYQWGLHHKDLMRAGVVVDLCGSVVDECHQLLGTHKERPLAMVTAKTGVAR